MKSILLLFAASLMLVGATIAVAMPNPVQANPNFDWCLSFAGGDCFSNKGDCKKAIPTGVSATCEKVYKIVP